MAVFENNLDNFIKNLKKQLESNNGFEFWRYLEEFERIFLALKNKRLGKIEKNVHIEGILFLEKGSIIKAGTRIEGNAYIGKDSIIGPNAYLRKNVYIGDNCHISNSEIKNSIILNNSNIPHYSYVGDSIIGEDVNLGAGTKIANLRFDNSNIKVEINGKKIDSNRRKLGALINSGTKIGINCSINCGIIIRRNSFINPGTVVKKNY